MSPMLELSVAIVTLNEEATLARTLASVAWAKEIIVVDSGSIDRTAEIARAHGARVIEREWPGFVAQKNFAIEQCSGAWVLSLDADEELTPELQQEIQKLLAANPTLHAYYLKRRNYFLGRWIKHGGFYPDAKLRLFRRSTAKFAERAVHETIAFDGKTETLKFDLIHHAYPTLTNYIEHMNRYSSLGAEVLIARGRTSTSWLAFVMNVCVVPQWMFQWNYFFRLGFLDGRGGLLLHLYHAVYTSWKYAKAWDLARKKH
jgi:glycosyltransferase involved in cell wall biosynthesis